MNVLKKAIQVAGRMINILLGCCLDTARWKEKIASIARTRSQSI